MDHFYLLTDIYLLGCEPQGASSWGNKPFFQNLKALSFPVDRVDGSHSKQRRVGEGGRGQSIVHRIPECSADHMHTLSLAWPQHHVAHEFVAGRLTG